MDESEFWAIVESSKAASDGTLDGRADSLAERLSTLSPDKVAAFDRRFTALTYKAYSWGLWGAAYVINGGCSDDGFTDFRSWLISMGRRIYDGALSDPESLADVELGPEGEEEASFEEFAYVAARVYEEQTGNELPRDPKLIHPSDPSGEPWEEDSDALAERYPRLSAKYGNS
jgi:uncharacterized protein DUF4240